MSEKRVFEENYLSKKKRASNVSTSYKSRFFFCFLKNNLLHLSSRSFLEEKRMPFEK